jgi:hypothetical protein
VSADVFYRVAKWPHLPTALFFAGVFLLALGAIFAVQSYLQPTELVRNEVEYVFTISSAYDGYVSLVPNPVFGDRTPLKSLPVYLAVARNITVGHRLSFSGGQFSGSVRYDVYLAHPDGWRLPYMTNATVPVEINITAAAAAIDSVAKVLGVSASDFSIVVVASASGEMTRGPYRRPVELVHPISISISRGRNKIELSGNLTASQTYNSTRQVRTPLYLLGRPVEEIRTASVATALAGLALTAASTAASSRRKRPEESVDERLSPFTVEVLEAEIPAAVMLQVPSPDALAKLAKMLERPIIKQKLRDRVRYMVLDRGTIYYYET